MQGDLSRDVVTLPELQRDILRESFLGFRVQGLGFPELQRDILRDSFGGAELMTMTSRFTIEMKEGNSNNPR